MKRTQMMEALKDGRTARLLTDGPLLGIQC